MRSGSRSSGDDGHEQMQLLHRRIRQHQQRQKHLEGRKKIKEQEMVREYKEQLETHRTQAKEEVRERLAHLQRIQARVSQRSTADDALPSDFSQEHSDSDFLRLAIQPRTRAKTATSQKQRSDVLRAPSSAATGLAGHETEEEHQLELGLHTCVNTLINTGHFPQPKGSPEAVAASDGPTEGTANDQQSPPTPPDAAGHVGRKGTGSDQSLLSPTEVGVHVGRTHQVHRKLARRHRLEVMHHVAAEVLQYRRQMAAGAYQITFPPL